MNIYVHLMLPIVQIYTIERDIRRQTYHIHHYTTFFPHNRDDNMKPISIYMNHSITCKQTVCVFLKY